MSTVLLHPPLVGRERELKSLYELMEAAFAGKGTVILVTGEAGIGKTRLCEEFGKFAAEKGCEVVVGRCVPGAPTPYVPFQDAFRRIIVPERGTGLIDWLKGPKTVAPAEKELALVDWLKGPKTPAARRADREAGLDPESHSERTLHATLEFLRKLSAKRPVVMVLEDLHWADSPSIQLLHFIARNSEDLRLLLIGTYRPEDLVVKASGEVHPLLDSLRIMRREQVCQELTLDRLNLEELRLAVKGMLRGPIESDLLEEVASESGGNPLFAVEAVRLLSQTASIAMKDGAWKATGRVPIDVPSTVREVILRRVERLSLEQRRLLECASVAGVSFDSLVVGGVLSLDQLTVLETLDLISRNTLLVSASDELYSFSHEKVQRTIYEEISSPRRRELHKTIGKILETRMPDEGLYGQLSVHFFSGGEVDKCIRYSLLAGQSSLRRFGTAEAIVYFEKVLDLTKDQSTAQPRLEALEGIGDARKAIGLDNSAVGHYDEFLKLSLTSKDKARVMRKCAECLLVSNTPRALELLELAEGCKEIESVEHGRVIKLRGSYAVISGTLDQAQGFFSKAQQIFEDTGSIEDLAKLCHSLSDLYLSRGLTKDALTSAQEAVELFSKLQSPIGEANASFQLGSVHWNTGLHEQAIENYSRAITTLVKFGRYRALAEVYEYRAGLNYAIEDFESSRADALKAHEYASKANSTYWQAHSCFLLSIAEIRLNRIAEGEKWYQKGSELLKSLGELADMRSPLSIQAMVAEAIVLDAKGEWAASKERFLKSIELYEGTYWGVLHEALACTQLGKAALARGLKAEARAQFGRAAEIYERLGNQTQLQKMSSLLTHAA